MKEDILKVLLENTDIERLYTGGDYEPIITVFKDSKNCDREKFLSLIADKIVNELNNGH